MSENQKPATKPKRRIQSGNKSRHAHDKKPGATNQHQYHKNQWHPSGNNRWPSAEHKCILIYHADQSLSLDDIKASVSQYGTVVETKRSFLPDCVMSAVELSSASEAENVWKKLRENSSKKIQNVTPDSMNKTITVCSPYWDDGDIQGGLLDGSLLQGTLRINPKMYQNAYISDGKNPDILFDSIVARNRALNGDEVAVKLRPQEKWITDDKPVKKISQLMEGLVLSPTQDASSQSRRVVKTGDVVGILEKRHNRVCVGTLNQCRQDQILFAPVDSCIPRLLIPKSQCPIEFLTRPDDYKNKLFVARILDWDEKNIHANAELCQFIGDRGEIEPETNRILLEHSVDSSEFPPTVNDSLPSVPWKVPQEEYARRRDLRSECVFTIDPSTAKDLDDALHCKKIGDNLFEIGVHIADVSYFVKPRSQVDEIAAKRCTSVYLVQRVIPMLPTLLCEELCSLNPGQDRLTYSVIWNITGEGKIVDEWFGRTVIHSCVKMSYDHAQSFIDDPDKSELNPDNFPPVNGGHSLESIRSKVLDLHRISQSLRAKRYNDGALQLNQIRLSYLLDEETGMPNSCFTYEYKASNELIEEYMLLANIAVAHKLRRSLPDHAFLRCHPEPKEDMLKTMSNYCAENGLRLDTSSAKALAASLRVAAGNNSVGDHCFLGLQLLAIKPQELAIYFCAGCVDDEEKFRHYALNVPLYTHFTSPIRRYADIIVHRQLSAALGDPSDMELANSSPEELQKQADICNIRKSEAKKVQDMSVNLFFCALLKSVGCLESEAVVIYVHDRSFDILTTKYGQVLRVYLDSLPIVGSKQTKDDTQLELLWPCDGTERYKLSEEEFKKNRAGKLEMPKYSETITQTIKVFSTVAAVLEMGAQPMQVKAYIRRKSDNDNQR